MVDLARLSDSELLAHASALSGRERQTVVALIIALREIDARKLHVAEGYPSLFVYCRDALHLSEAAAYSRIEVARASRAFPELLDALKTGELTPTTAMLLAPHLTPENVARVLTSARFRTKREVEVLVAALRPKPDVRDQVRKQPDRAPAPDLLAPTPEAVPPATLLAPPVAEPPEALPTQASRITPAMAPSMVSPLSPGRYKVQFTADEETEQKLRRAQSLLRHQIPNGDLCAIIGKALTLLIADIEKRKLGMTTRPRNAEGATVPGSRHIPMRVRREVWKRDGGRCAFIGSQGRCHATEPLEFHHVVPFAAGGAPTTENIQLRCRTHNQHEGVLFFGERAMSRRTH